MTASKCLFPDPGKDLDLGDQDPFQIRPESGSDHPGTEVQDVRVASHSGALEVQDVRVASRVTITIASPRACSLLSMNYLQYHSHMLMGMVFNFLNICLNILETVN